MIGSPRGSGRSSPDVRGEADHARSISASIADRELHDRLICYLTDASFRSSENRTEFLDEAESQRAERFSHFLARRYYRDRLTRGFRYSPLIRPGIPVPEVVDSPEFDRILDRCALGSFLTAQQVGELAATRSLASKCAKPWFAELVEYERALFLQLATSETRAPGEFARRNASSILREFAFAIPELIRAIRSNQSLERPFQGGVTLLFSRTHHGRICVAEIDANTRAVFEAVDGNRTAQQIAEVCHISAEENRRILGSLGGIGSIVPQRDNAESTSPNSTELLTGQQ